MRTPSQKGPHEPNLYVWFCIARITATLSAVLIATGILTMVQGTDSLLSCVLLSIGGLLLLPVVIGCIKVVNRLGAGVMEFLSSLEHGGSEEINRGLESLCHMAGTKRRTHITRLDRKRQLTSPETPDND